MKVKIRGEFRIVFASTEEGVEEISEAELDSFAFELEKIINSLELISAGFDRLNITESEIELIGFRRGPQAIRPS